MYIYNSTKTAVLMPLFIDITPEPIIPLRKRIIKIMFSLVKILLFIQIILVVLIGGTLLIMKFCPLIYPIWLILVFVAGWIIGEIIS